MFEVGEIVRCVKKHKSAHYTTVGGHYKIIDIDKPYIRIKNDNGYLLWLHAENFIKACVGVEDVVATSQHQNTLDSHYNFTYKLTPEDIAAGQIKLDPYFVSSQWKLGSKDESGALWHVFKTIARFGEKNDKEREVRAMFASLKRLAQILNITLEK